MEPGAFRRAIRAIGRLVETLDKLTTALKKSADEMTYLADELRLAREAREKGDPE